MKTLGMKTVGLMPRRPDITRAKFRDHYENGHAPLALRNIKDFPFQKYVRNHLTSDAPDDVLGAPIDSLSEFWFKDAAAVDQARAFLATPAGELVREDERRFTDQPKIASFQSNELLIAGRERPNEAGATLAKAAWPLLLDAAYRGDSDGRDLQAALAKAVAGIPGRWTLDLQVPGRTYGTVPFDAILFHWVQDKVPGDMEERLQGIARPLARLDALQIETPDDKLAP